MCKVHYCGTLIDFIGYCHKYTEWGWKKNDMNLYLDIFSFIVDIRPGSKYHSDERNKLIIIINIYSGSIYKSNGFPPYKLKKSINKRIKTDIYV